MVEENVELGLVALRTVNLGPLSGLAPRRHAALLTRFSYRLCVAHSLLETSGCGVKKGEHKTLSQLFFLPLYLMSLV